MVTHDTKKNIEPIKQRCNMISNSNRIKHSTYSNLGNKVID